MKNLAFVFDLDKTIGYFTQLAIFMESIEDYIKRPLKLKEFYKNMCKEKKIEFVDTNEFIISSDYDPIHWSKKTHKDFGEILAKIFAKKIKH